MHCLFRKNSTLPKCISYIIAYYSQASQSYIGIINHGSNLIWLHGSSYRQPILRSSKNGFIFIFIKKILWQVLCHGQLIFLLSTWQMDKHFVNPDFVHYRYQKQFLGVRSWYCNKMPILWVCVDILQWVFSVLIEADNIYQQSGWPSFSTPS